MCSESGSHFPLGEVPSGTTCGDLCAELTAAAGDTWTPFCGREAVFFGASSIPFRFPWVYHKNHTTDSKGPVVFYASSTVCAVNSYLFLAGARPTTDSAAGKISRTSRTGRTWRCCGLPRQVCRRIRRIIGYGNMPRQVLIVLPVLLSLVFPSGNCGRDSVISSFISHRSSFAPAAVVRQKSMPLRAGIPCSKGCLMMSTVVTRSEISTILGWA